jgi:hypothetical protein
MKYFDEEFGTVQYDDRSEAVIGQLTSFVQGKPFKEYMNAMIEATRDQSANNMIGDTSSLDGPVSQEDQAWSVQDWAPRAEAAGLEHLALVMPESVVAEMSVDKIVEMADDSLNRELFDDLQDAKMLIP